jgi:hypothetical protein
MFRELGARGAYQRFLGFGFTGHDRQRDNTGQHNEQDGYQESDGSSFLEDWHPGLWTRFDSAWTHG